MPSGAARIAVWIAFGALPSAWMLKRGGPAVAAPGRTKHEVVMHSRGALLSLRGGAPKAAAAGKHWSSITEGNRRHFASMTQVSPVLEPISIPCLTGC